MNSSREGRGVESDYRMMMGNVSKFRPGFDPTEMPPSEEAIYALSANRLDQLLQTGLVDGQVAAIPCRNLLLGNVHHCHFHSRRLGGDDGHGRAADVAGAHAANLEVVGHGTLRYLTL